jgi:selenide,water dikinase
LGIATSDDAGVYKLRDDLAIVQTVDFFTPIVDDPYDFGRIAAANSLSDIYAMGAVPITALNIAAFPMETLGGEVLAQILAGGAAVASEAGVAILGGHTVEDAEPKYGMSVTGTVHPDRFVRNAGARPGDVLILTKPIGTGVLATALKRGTIDASAMAPAVAWMTRLNAAASRAMIAHGASAATDITGFGLLGHGGEMARASEVALEITASAVPLLDRARELVLTGAVPGGSKTNRCEHERYTTYAAGVDEALRVLFSDAQTSGGLLIAMHPDRAAALQAALRTTGECAAAIGRVANGSGISVVV